MSKGIINQLQTIMDKQNIDVLLLTDGYNVHFISGYKGHTGCMLVFKDKRFILTDSRYTEQVTIEAPEVECKDIAGLGYSKLVANIIKEQLGEGCFRLGFENNQISYSEFKAYEKAMNEFIEFVELGDSIDELRQVKSSEEIELLAKAESIGDEAFSHILTVVKAGMKESEVALALEVYMRSHGATGLSFDTIAASGPNSSLPHAVPTDRVLQDGDFLTMDFGCVFDGYCSDMTRTIHIGNKVNPKQLEVYNIVLKAQLAALDSIKPGMKCSDVDAVARNIIKDAGYGAYFGHGLGHSVGLFIHEEPRFSPKCDAILEPGMVITVEPGIYLPGEFGVRIEDMVVITENGYRNLAKSSKELICI